MSLLLSLTAPSPTISPTDHADDQVQYHTAEQIFKDVLFMMLFLAALWIVGKISVRLAMPALVGEIITGIIMGPNLLDIVPTWAGLVVLGDIGLLLLVLEAGIDVNMGVLKVVGSKGLAVAIFGSMFPLGIGTGLAYLIHPSINPRTAVAIGACFAPTSMGIALNVLRNGGVLNTPTGQLIIAAAVLDDVIALMLLSVLQELSVENPSIFDIVFVIAISPILILVFGFISIRISPRVIKWVMEKIDIHYHEYAILLMLFGSMMALVPMCFYVKSSYLLGAFLAGIMLCTDHTIHHAWDKQMKRIMAWMLRIFFACTIGFAVPILDFLSDSKIVYDALIYFIAVIGKLATGFFATSRPIQVTEFCMISFSMAAWGEFAFILATQAYGAGIITKDTMTSVLMAVLLSVIIAPLGLRADLQIMKKQKQFYMQEKRKETIMSINSITLSQQHRSPIADFSGGVTPADSERRKSSVLSAEHEVYYCIHTNTAGKWGHQNNLLKSLYGLSLEIIDFRSFNEPQDNYSHIIVQNIFYVKDTKLSLLPSRRLHIASKRRLSERVKQILNTIHIALQDKEAKVVISRWLPGIRQKDDIALKKSDVSEVGQIKVIPLKKAISVKYVRNSAYKQARIALSYARLPIETAGDEEEDEEKHGEHGKRKKYEDNYNVLNAQSDELVTLVDEEHEDRDEEHTQDTMSLNIVYGDEHHQPPTPSVHSVELSGNVQGGSAFGAVVTSNPNTPLLKSTKDSV